MDRPLDVSLPTAADLRKYVFRITDATPASLLQLAQEHVEKDGLLDYIAHHKIHETIAAFERKFTAKRLHPETMANHAENHTPLP
jgi:hypothetical protein